MPNPIAALSEHWDLWVGQYRAFFPAGEEDRQACLALMAEAGLFNGEAVDPSDRKGASRLAACQDTQSGEIVACLALTGARSLEMNPSEAAAYSLERFGETWLPGIVIATHLVIHPTHLKTAAATALLSHCIIEWLKAGGQALLMLCDPGHFSIYKRLGMRPIGPLQKIPGGEVRLPMIFLPDGDYLSIIRSPVLPLMRGVDFSRYEALCQWYYRLVRNNSELQIGAAFYPEQEEDFVGHHAITDGLSEKGREAFLENTLVINCREGEILIRENDSGKAFGFVSRGLVKVVIGGKTVVLLGEGDIFGEIAYILGGKRTAQVVAASSETEVVLFSENAIDRLELESDRTALWRNLARVLAQRVVLTNKLLD